MGVTIHLNIKVITYLYKRFQNVLRIMKNVYPTFEMSGAGKYFLINVNMTSIT